MAKEAKLKSFNKKEWYLKNRDRILATARKRYKEDESYKLSIKEQRQKHKYAYPEYHKIWKAKNEDKYKNYNLKKFGITLKDYNIILEKQNGVCAICKRICKTGRALAVDHCHNSKKVRGLLCTKCNRGLGLFEDNIEFLLTAIKYLNE